jgi:hypothetical protein
MDLYMQARGQSLCCSQLAPGAMDEKVSYCHCNISDEISLLLAAEAPLPPSASLPAKIPDLSPKSTFTDMTIKTGVV